MRHDARGAGPARARPCRDDFFSDSFVPAVLTDGARAESIPNLEIETGDIRGAGHASATGRFDDEQLFYLQSRGISEDEARRLVVVGFLSDIVQRIGIPALESELHEAIQNELREIEGESQEGAAQ